MSHALPEKTLSLPATLNSLTTLGNALREFLSPLRLSESWIYPLDLALCEAASNIIRHAYLDDPQKTYRVSFQRDTAGVTVTLCDTGQAVPAEKLDARKQATAFDEPMDTLSEGGRGWPLIYASVDSVCYQRCNDENQLILRRALPG